MQFVLAENILPTSKTIEVGWWIKRDKGWHTYWESPGDVGVPPSLEWELPDGITSTGLLFAPPQLVKMFKVFAHGHKDETLFICTFNVKRELKVGEILTFSAKAAWLTCYKTCLPSYANLDISFPVKMENGVDTKWHSRFEEFRKTQPIDAPTKWIQNTHASVGKSANSEKEFVTLLFPFSESGKLPGFRFFTHGRNVLSNIYQVPRRVKINGDDSFLSISMELSYWRDPQQKKLEGLLYRSDGWPGGESKFYKVSVPIQNSKGE
jgi:DsbC/DsbD-like thiol-disulfide interchange protein